MTQWTGGSVAGRRRGPAGLVRAWVGVLVTPRRFFRSKVAPGDQAPGVTFAVAVVVVAESVRILAFAGAYPVVGGARALSAVLWVLLATVLIAPAGIHLVAALQTLLLMAAVSDRAGVSETVQVVCYALAPCVLAGVPSPPVQAAVALWGAGLLVVGIGTVHDVAPAVALAVAVVPAVVVFGYGFGGTDALLTLWSRVAA